MTPSKTFRGVFLALLAGTCWGFSGTVGQFLFTSRQVDSGWLTVVRMLVSGLILLVWKRVHGLPDEDVLCMFWTACVANRVYRLTRRRDTSDVVTLLLSLAFLVWNLVKFFQTV